jgi:hypothetical protein
MNLHKDQALLNFANYSSKTVGKTKVRKKNMLFSNFMHVKHIC